jgi:hypothetical protein
MSCGSFCDYEKYYLIQAGGARDDILYYSGIPYQRGSNIFLRCGKRFGIPIFKFLLNTGKDVIKDIMMEEKPKNALVNNLKSKTTEAIENVADRITQSGGFVKRKKKSNSSKIIKTKKFKKSLKGRKIRRRVKFHRSKDIFQN